MRCFRRRSRALLPAATWPSPELVRLTARQHPHVDPILEIGRGAELGPVLAGEGRHHLAEHAEVNALRRLVPHHRFESDLKRAMKSCRQTTMACGSGRAFGFGGAVSFLSADQISAALVAKGRRVAAGGGPRD